MAASGPPVTGNDECVASFHQVGMGGKVRPDGWTVESATSLKGASPAQDGSGWGRE